jgi:general stress protein 26
VDETDTELLQALVQGFDRAMLVSRCGNSMRSRPTTVANTGDKKRLWLLSGILGDGLEELSEDPNVNVVMQDGVRFCSVTGTARIARPTGDEAIWNERQRAWLAHGARRSSLVLIEIAPQFAEYWDRSGLRGLRFDTAPPAADVEPGAAGGRAPYERHPTCAPNGADRRSNVIMVEQARWKRLCVTSKTC